ARCRRRGLRSPLEAPSCRRLRSAQGNSYPAAAAARTPVLHRKSLFASRQVNREPLKVGQRTISQGTLVGGTQNHARRFSCFQGFLPTRRTQAPAITGFQTGKP